jgi:hypothetical protein
MSDAASLVGTRIRRVDAFADGLLGLTLHGVQVRGVLLIGLPAAARGVGWLERRPDGRVQSPFVLRCRSCLEGGRIASLEQSDTGELRLDVERGGERFVLEAELRGALGEARLYAADGTRLASLRGVDATGSGTAPALTPSGIAERVRGGASSSQPPPALIARELTRPLELDWPRLRADGERLATGHGEIAHQRKTRELARALRAEIRREQRKLAAIEGDLQRCAEVPELRRNASLVLTHLSALARNCTEASLLDYASDPPQQVELRFDAKLGPKLQAEAWFRRARRLERGAAIATARADAARARLVALQALIDRLETTEPPASEDEIAQAAKEARAFGIATSVGAESQPAAQPKTRLPYREFVGSGGRPILVGRGALDNDRLTLDHARPHDLWLHARDGSGAHVVVPLGREEACPAELLCDAATLTAHFSHARGQARADVIYTTRRYVRKPRKSAVGSVQLLREKVFALRLEPDRLQRLLASEKGRRA